MKQNPANNFVPTLVEERLRSWGMTVRKQRIAQKIRAVDLCARIGISHPTLRRIESGQASVAVAAYLSALQILGIFDRAAPALPAELWSMSKTAPRARPYNEDDDDYF